MAKSGASKGAKKIKPFDDMDTKLAMGVTRIPSVSPVEQIKSGKALEEKIRLERYEKKLKKLEGRQKGLA